MPCTPIRKQIKFVKGSHRLGYFIPRKFATLKNYAIETDENINQFKDISTALNDVEEDRIVSWDLEVYIIL